MSAMSTTQVAARPTIRIGWLGQGVLIRGVVAGYLSLIVLIPLAALVWRA